MPTTPDSLEYAAAALKALAADPPCRAAFLAHPALSRLFAAPAGRYVVARNRQDLAKRLCLLAAKGYRLGIEYVGEEVSDPEQIEGIVAEYLALIDEAEGGDSPVQLGFDLSNVGLLVSSELAAENAVRILQAAAVKNISVVISMERSGFVDRIIDIFTQLAPEHPNVGLTLQAHLRRTPADLPLIAAYGRKVRLVKGVYEEQPDVAIRRGPELNRRYAELAGRLVEQGTVLACGTHDGGLLQLLDERGILRQAAEIEMLHGVRPQLLKRYRERGVPCRVATVYGSNWWLHFLHRLSEYPPNVLTALADMAEPARIRFGGDY